MRKRSSGRRSARRAAAGIGVALGAAILVAPPSTAPAPLPGLAIAAWRWPTPPPHAVLRPFRAPLTAYGSGHRGIDLAAAPGTIVSAPAAGVVFFAGIVVDRPVLSIEHAGGLLSSFEAVESPLAEGTPVRAGDPVGVVAASAHCPGASCLHFGVRRNGRYLSPLLMLGGVPRSVLLPLREPVEPASRSGPRWRGDVITSPITLGDAHKAREGRRMTLQNNAQTTPRLIDELEHERVLLVRGPRSGLQITVAVHSTRLGPALGGCRMWHYDSGEDALADALRLSEAMTLKNAAAGLPAGGGKSVIRVPADRVLDAAQRRDALLDLGDAIESLGGAYNTAEDVGTTSDDMAVVHERTEHVVGLPSATGGVGEPSEPTAIGVYSAIQATVRRLTGTDSVRGLRFTIVGLGQVGSRLARRLTENGALLTVTDVYPAKRALAEELGAEWVEPQNAHRVETDVFVPAGVGGILTDEVIDSLRCRAVVGPANNQLASPAGADRLARRGILWAPDFVVNAGGVIYLFHMNEAGAEREDVFARIEGIGATLTAVFDEAELRGTTPAEAARLLAAEKLSAGTRQTVSAV
jgi:leucine dehydrogenase